MAVCISGSTISEMIAATCQANDAPIEFFIYLIALLEMSGGNPSLPCSLEPQEFEVKLRTIAERYGFEVRGIKSVERPKLKGN